jgi:hypothetical protein
VRGEGKVGQERVLVAGLVGEVGVDVDRRGLPDQLVQGRADQEAGQGLAVAVKDVVVLLGQRQAASG